MRGAGAPVLQQSSLVLLAVLLLQGRSTVGRGSAGGFRLPSLHQLPKTDDGGPGGGGAVRDSGAALPQGFRLHGQVTAIGGLFNLILAAGPTPGSQLLYASHGYDGAPFDIVAVDPITGTTDVFSSPIQSECGAYGLIEGADGRVYVGTLPSAHVMVVDWPTKKLVDLGRPASSEQYIWALARGSDGNIYGATYPHAKLIRVHPQSGAGDDLGRLSETQSYAHYIAADDNGFVYAGIGPGTQNDLVAYEISSGQRRSILPTEWRSSTRIAMLFPSTDGSVYAMWEGQWRQLRGWNTSATHDERPPSTLAPGYPNLASGNADFAAVPLLRLRDGRAVSYDGRTVALQSRNGSTVTHSTGYTGVTE